MKGAIKIVTIGGGSSYTPELMEGFIKRYEDLPIKEIWLVDIEDGKEKVEIVGALAQRMWDASPYQVKVHTTLDRREAFPGAPLFRIGGDEFVVQLDGLGQEQVTRGILAMERAVKAYSDGNVFPAGIAAGYAFFDPGKDVSLESTLARADTYMYRKKHKMKH